MKFLPLLFLVSCASVLPKEKTVRKEVITITNTKDSHESIKYTLSKLMDDQDERLVYENKEQGIINFQLIEPCKPEAIGYLELRFMLESKVVGNSLELSFRGKDMRHRTLPLYHQPSVQMISEDIYCNEAEVSKAYDKTLNRIHEELGVQRTVASDKK